ncbi:MAG TPA: hypothetical protein VGO93_08595, partial [Candidatus Xenobia bacterium]
RVTATDGSRFETVAELRGSDGRPRTTARAVLQGVSPALFRRYTGWREIPPGWRELFQDAPTPPDGGVGP